MNIKTYSKLIKRTLPDLGSELNNQMHMAIGASTETGELLDAYKKLFAYNKPLDKINIAEEIGDCLWYLINLCGMLELNIEDILENNIEKLQTRFPDKFTQEDANIRNLTKERTILEKMG